MEGVDNAIKKEDFEMAAKYIQRYQTIDSEILTKEDFKQLQNAELQLKQVIETKTNESLKTKIPSQILRYCTIYTVIGMKEKTIENYVKYLESILLNVYNEIYKMMFSEMTPIDALTSLFQTVADMIADQEPIMERNFGIDVAFQVLKALKTTIDNYATKILNIFTEKFKIENCFNVFAKTLKEKPNLKNFSKTVESVVPKETTINEILDDIAMVSKITSIFQNFVNGQMKIFESQIEKNNNENKENEKLIENNNKTKETLGNRKTSEISTESLLDKRIQEIINYYITIEKFFIQYQTLKATTESEELSEDGLTSKMIDYLFFVLQQSIQRSISSLNIEAVCALCNVIQFSLDDFLVFLQNSIRESSFSFSSRNKNNYTLVLNNISVCSDFIFKLNRDLFVNSKQIFKEEKELKKLQNSCNEINEIAKKYKNSLKVKKNFILFYFYFYFIFIFIFFF